MIGRPHLLLADDRVRFSRCCAGVGSPFDPSLHDGIMREASEDVPDGTVLEEFRKGFTLGGKLLRPAMVKVSFSDAPAAPAAAAADAAADDAAAEGAEAAASDSE